MSASFSRPRPASVIPFRTRTHSDFRMSVELPEGSPEHDVYAGIRLAEKVLDDAYRAMNKRADEGRRPIITPEILDSIREAADTLNIAADNGEFAVERQ